MSDLAEIQSRFAAGLLTLGEDPIELFRASAGADPQRSMRRFALYRGNLTANWEKALAGAYPVLKRLVGEEFFRALAREYGRAIPLVEGDLNRFGDQLADFLERFPPVADYPYMPDMARLEWALHRAHSAADTPALDLKELAVLDAEGLDGLRLRLREPCTLLGSPWAVFAIWQAHQPVHESQASPAWPKDLAQPSRYLVCRPRWRAEVLPLASGQFTALQAITDGAPLGAALEAGATADTGFDPAAALPAWLQAGVFAAPAEFPSTSERTDHERTG